MKKSLRFLMAAVMVSISSSSIFAADPNTVGYKFSVSKGGAKFSFEVLTPCVIEGEETTYGTAKLYKFTQNEDSPLTEVTSSYVSSLSLTSGYKYRIVEIADGVFKDQAAITKVAASAYVKKIGASAFEGCSGVAQFQFDVVQEIGENAFKDCSAASAKIYFLGSQAPTVGNGAFDGIASNAQIRFNITKVTPEHLNNFSAYSSKLRVYIPFSKTSGYIKLMNCQVPLKLSDPEENLNIYYVKSATETETGLNVELGALQTGEFNIPANTALIYQYKGTSESPALIRNFLSSDPTPSYTNLLIANKEKVTLPASDGKTNYYVFTPADITSKESNADLSFTKVTEETAVAAGEGYLKIVNDGTGISKVMMNTDGKEVMLYDLNGHRVNDNYKGIIIMNGKKHLKK